MVVLCLSLLAACTAERQTACPAIGWPSVLEVRLAPEWPEDAADAVTVEPFDGPDEEAVVPLVAGAAEVGFSPGYPNSVLVTVVDAGGRMLAVHEAGLDWVRVGGTEACGGPHEAEVVVPAP